MSETIAIPSDEPQIANQQRLIKLGILTERTRILEGLNEMVRKTDYRGNSPVFHISDILPIVKGK